VPLCYLKTSRLIENYNRPAISNNLLERKINMSANEYISAIEKLTNFNIGSFSDDRKTREYVNIFSIDKLCQTLEVDRLSANSNLLERSVSAFEKKPFEPKFSDLCRLHYIALTRKSINILEFGSGFSTVVLADAMRILRGQFYKYAKENFRIDVPFHVFSVEEEQRFLEISQNRLQNLSAFATISRSSVELIRHDNRVATLYSKLPNISPDFIYIDGPSQFCNTSDINRFSFNSKSRAPMSADVLLFEFFLEPDTLLLIDGRTANAQFLMAYLKRKWAYHHDEVGDIHYFELQESPLGPLNQKKLEFCLENKWLLGPSYSTKSP
jgi:hypothetical protein